ncbi:TIGR02680 family protein [Streptomyces sp. yr375]|uniref:TIGR02680 family protein n=1 Tax=Streptomyces sp. yr375 TaxID=1761906 RepID=UPI0008AD8FA0|nr:TIGR02680 family protein [Streptomyces sp. yr375]SEQ71278.1 TIGR02680 family protein [Streptomyces sp. yr375]
MNVTELPVRGTDRPDAAPPTAPTDTTTRPTGGTPEARNRWQPVRAGILNVWRYYDETFTFHEGRLLLRGPNGTGKSKALELLLPFLFDANLRPHRLSTFGGSERTMHWNLMGEGATGKTRVGYVWLEFGHADGRWFSCGARLQASIHTSGVQTDYFTTARRLARPDGVSLVNEAGQPLTRPALADALALAGDGEIHATAADYRATIRRTLFDGLGEQRFEALITALLQLRQPKLSERLDPSLLSTLLSKALPPLGESEIGELAEGFERLDRQREDLKRLDEEVTAAAAIAGRQRGYTQRVLRSAAAQLISATTDMDNRARIARESAEQHRQAVHDQEATGRRRAELGERVAELEAAVQGLLDSDLYQQGKELDQLRRRTQDTAQAADRLRATADDRQRRARADEEQAATAARQAEECAHHARDTAEDAERTARTVGMESVHTEMRAALADAPADAPTADDPAREATRVRQVRHLLRGAVKGRRDQMAAVREAVERHERAVGDRTAAETLLDGARDGLAEAMTRRDEAARECAQALRAQAEQLREWAAGCVELRIGDVEELAARAAVEADVLAVVERAVRALDQQITQSETRVEAARKTGHDQRERFVRAIEALTAEADLPPVAPPTRTTDRSTMEGAPLWRLVAFRDGVPEEVQAGVEAALEASGLLDAWLSPEDTIDLAGHDTFAAPGWATPAPGPSLREVLRPEKDIPVAADRVDRLLAGIAYGEHLPHWHTAAVAADGSWRLAAAIGTWSKAAPAHIGAHARDQARQRRITDLTDRLTALNTHIAALDTRLGALRESRSRLDADLAARPRHRELDETRRRWDRAEEAVGVRDDAVRRAVKVLDGREADVSRCLRTLGRLSSEHALPTERGRLNELSAAVDAFADTADAWADAHLHWSTALGRSAAARHQAERSTEAAREAQAEADRADAEARALAATLQAADSTVGEDFRQTAVRIGELRQDVRRSREQISASDGELGRLQRRIGSLEATMAMDALRRDEATAARDASALRFRHLCLLGLPQDAGVPPDRTASGLTASDGTRATLEAAREIAAEWPGLAHEPRNLGDAVQRLSEAVHQARQVLGRRADLDLEADDDVQIFTATMDGARIGATGLLHTLTAERDGSRDDITVAERRLFDQTLTGDTRRHLAARIRQANELVDRMNGHLERVRTASKVSVQLVWRIHPDLPAGTQTARTLLLKEPKNVTDADREALHDFFRARIEEAKARNTAATWEEQLAEVLDYTAWHQFVVRLDRANGAGWQVLTKKLHGALSGGEKAIALHLPLFAAVAAHYEAVPEAPRPILLDEVFVGVDTTNRGQIFALLTALDLDLMLTSDHEWCHYRELPGIAIHQLITGTDGDDAVTSARFVWTGAGMRADEGDGGDAGGAGEVGDERDGGD